MRLTEIMEKMMLANVMPKSRVDNVRITFYVPEWVRSAIKQEIARGTETQSGWILELVTARLNSLGYYPPVEYGSLQELIQENRQMILDRSRITPDELKKIETSNLCDDILLLRIAIALDISEEEIRLIAGV